MEIALSFRHSQVRHQFAVLDGHPDFDLLTEPYVLAIEAESCAVLQLSV